MTSEKRPGSVLYALLGLALVFVFGACGDSPPPATPAGAVETTTSSTTSTTTLSFASCAAALDAGYHDMAKGAPGYSARLDGDGDGMACDTEPTTTTTASKATTTTRPTMTTTTLDNKMSLRVGDMDPAACEEYAAKQTRLNGGAKWTARMDGTTCVVTQE